MWWLLWGMALPAAIAGAFLERRGPFLWGGGLLFILANLILFQPISWDNSKIFLWAYFGLSGCMAQSLRRLWARGPLVRPFALVLSFWLTVTGLANFVHLFRTDRHRGDDPLGQRARNRGYDSARDRPLRCLPDGGGHGEPADGVGRAGDLDGVRRLDAQLRRHVGGGAGTGAGSARHSRRRPGLSARSAPRTAFGISTSGRASAARRGAPTNPPSPPGSRSGCTKATSRFTKYRKKVS